MYVSPHDEPGSLSGVFASVAGARNAIGEARHAATPPIDTAPGGETDEADLALTQAHSMLQFVRVSRELFPDMRDLADHPGWEIMLHLYIAAREGRTVSTTVLCEITGCWRPLAIRYIELLFERGIVDRDVTPDKPDDWPLRLTQEAEGRFLTLLCGFARGWTMTAPPAAD